MGIRDWLRPAQTKAAPEDLLQTLRDGLRRQDYQLLMTVINENTAAIREQFPSWTKVPIEIRDDQAALQLYVHTLRTIATAFQQAGDSTLMDRLMGRDRGNPMVEWQARLERAQSLIDEGRAAESIPLMRSLLDDLRGVTGTAVDHFRPLALGRLGVALARAGERQEAIDMTREALRLCEQAGDEEGIRAYKSNLEAIGTYQIQRNDEPDGAAAVVFTDEQGRVLAPEDLSTAVGNIKWEVRSWRNVSPEADRLHREGRAAGARGDYDAALSLFTKAADADPSWPYPVYDRAFTHMLRNDLDAAVRDYERTLELSPRGFYTAHEALDTLRRERAGEFPRGLFAALAATEHMSEENQRAALEQIVEQAPSCAPAWARYSNFVRDAAERLSVIDRGLAARPDPDTRGSLLVRKAMMLSELGQTDSALEILEPLAAADGGTLSSNAKAYLALATIRRATGGKTSE